MSAMVDGLRRAWALGVQTLFPPRCLVHGTPLWGCEPAWLDAEAAATMPWLGEGGCPRCAAPPGPHAQVGRHCSDCRALGRPAFTRAAAVVRYDGPVPALIWPFKYRGLTALGPALVAAMADRLDAVGFPTDYDGVMPVPLHPTRRRA